MGNGQGKSPAGISQSAPAVSSRLEWPTAPWPGAKCWTMLRWPFWLGRGGDLFWACAAHKPARIAARPQPTRCTCTAGLRRGPYWSQKRLQTCAIASARTTMAWGRAGRERSPRPPKPAELTAEGRPQLQRKMAAKDTRQARIPVPADRVVPSHLSAMQTGGLIGPDGPRHAAAVTRREDTRSNRPPSPRAWSLRLPAGSCMRCLKPAWSSCGPNHQLID